MKLNRKELESKLMEVRKNNMEDVEIIEDKMLFDLDDIYMCIDFLRVDRKKIFNEYLVVNKIMNSGIDSFESELLEFIICMYNNVNCFLCDCMKNAVWSVEEIKEEFLGNGIEIKENEWEEVIEDLKILLGIIVK